MKKAVKEEWVELTDGKRKIIMPWREMVNLAHLPCICHCESD